MALLLAGAFAALVILSSPYVVPIVGAAQSAFGTDYRTTIGALLALSAAALLAIAVARVRDRFLRRYGMLALAVAASALYMGVFGTGNPDIDLVEAFHFVEYGVAAALFHVAWRRYRDARRVVFPLLAGVAAGILDEWLQWFIPSRVGEAHDVLIDLAAVAVGLVAAAAIDPPGTHAWSVRGGAARAVTGATTAALVLFAAFFYTVHVGYEIRDAEIGAFRSRYDGVTLQLLAVERARAWRAGAPAYATRFSREDHYFSEALWHVQERNEAAGRGDRQTAWRENRILEKFFTPVLDSPALAPRYRWTPEQRALMDAAAPPLAGSAYESAAQPFPIYVLP